jgi:hypothetical protein
LIDILRNVPHGFDWRLIAARDDPTTDGVDMSFCFTAKAIKAHKGRADAIEHPIFCRVVACGDHTIISNRIFGYGRRTGSIGDW